MFSCTLFWLRVFSSKIRKPGFGAFVVNTIISPPPTMSAGGLNSIFSFRCSLELFNCCYQPLLLHDGCVHIVHVKNGCFIAQGKIMVKNIINRHDAYRPMTNELFEKLFHLLNVRPWSARRVKTPLWIVYRFMNTIYVHIYTYFMALEMELLIIII